MKKLIELLFGKTKETGINRINKVVSHFQEMLDDLEQGSLEIKEDISDNQDAVKGLQEEITDLKADNTALGAELERATNMQRAISAIVTGDNQ